MSSPGDHATVVDLVAAARRDLEAVEAALLRLGDRDDRQSLIALAFLARAARSADAAVAALLDEHAVAVRRKNSGKPARAQYPLGV